MTVKFTAPGKGEQFPAGPVRFRILDDGLDLLAPEGSLVTAPIGQPHTFGNADPEAPASLLCTVVPERYLGYFRDLQGLRPGPDGVLDPAEVLEIMARYATEPYRG
jgi:hypothetical protein